MRKLIKELLIPSSILTSVSIGAGFLSLPYLFYQSGLLTGFFYLVTFAIVIAMIHLMYGEIIEETEKHYPGDHRFVGYAKMHLGFLGYGLSFLTTLIGIILALLIYLVIAVELLTPIFNLSDLPYAGYLVVILFAVLSAVPMFWGIQKVADLGFSITAGKIILIISILAAGIGGFASSFADIPKFNPTHIFLPYAGILFSLYGRSAVSTVKKYFKRNVLSHSKFERAIAVGTFIPVILYTFFIVGVLGISGGGVTEDSISGLMSIPLIWLCAVALGLISIWAAYVFLDFELNGILAEDFKLGNNLARVLAVAAPASLYFLGFNNLLSLIGIAGGVFISLESIMIIFMWNRVKKRNPALALLSFLIIAVFLFSAWTSLSGH